MKVKKKLIFDELRGQRIFPTISRLEYAKCVREIILREIGRQNAAEDSEIFKEVKCPKAKYFFQISNQCFQMNIG